MEDEDQQPGDSWTRYTIGKKELGEDTRVMSMKAVHSALTSPQKASNMTPADQAEFDTIVKGGFFVWRGVEKAAVTGRTTVSKQRVWEIALPSKALDVIEKGIRLGVLDVVDTPGGVVDLLAFWKEVKEDNTGGSAVVKGTRRSTRLHEKVEAEETELALLAKGECNVEEILDHIPRSSSSEEGAKTYLVKWEGDHDEKEQYWWVRKDKIRTGDAVSIPLRDYWKRVNEIKRAKEVAKFKSVAEELDKA
jgi:hypothetical protein